MATINQNRACLRSRQKNLTDFSKVGGLSTHIKLLREIIVFPLLYGDLYKHFNVKAPRGVLFYGPPGTGKTLVAGALATELTREGNGKVTFYQRKGADILDKWVGESERKLRDLFHQATRNRPSVIFFDELDGLAPVRSQKNDQVHCSVVATLLALMDGLDNTSGVVVIGATNRIDAIDPALRRPGRFDRELYFPLPSVDARKEILQVHTHSWRHKPTPEFLTQMSELTSGCCGADLQALCAEAFLCCLKRLYPNLHRPSLGAKVKIEADAVVVKDIDFLNARMNLVPTNQRLGNYRVRKLSPFIKPLLQRQLNKIIRYIQMLLPHFTQPFKKFLIGCDRYAGRLVLKGTHHQGLTVHVVPAILQTLEHIPCYILDIPALFENNIKNARQNLPSILVLSRVDDWWDLIDSSTQLGLTAMLQDLHAGLPLLLIATCSLELPDVLQDYFYSNSSISVTMEDPTAEEREQFFAPLFFGGSHCGGCAALNSELSSKRNTDVKSKAVDASNKNKNSNNCKGKTRKKTKYTYRKKQGETETNKNSDAGTKRKSEKNAVSPVPIKRNKIDENVGSTLQEVVPTTPENTMHCVGKHRKNICKCSTHTVDQNSEDTIDTRRCSSHMCTHHYAFERPMPKVSLCRNNYLSIIDLIDCSNILNCEPNVLMTRRSRSVTSIYNSAQIKKEPLSETSICTNYDMSDESSMSLMYNLWRRASHETSEGLTVLQLELLYDAISACIGLNRYDINILIPALERTLTNFENSSVRNTGELMDGNIE